MKPTAKHPIPSCTSGQTFQLVHARVLAQPATIQASVDFLCAFPGPVPPSFAGQLLVCMVDGEERDLEILSSRPRQFSASEVACGIRDTLSFFSLLERTIVPAEIDALVLCARGPSGYTAWTAAERGVVYSALQAMEERLPSTDAEVVLSGKGIQVVEQGVHEIFESFLPSKRDDIKAKETLGDLHGGVVMATLTLLLEVDATSPSESSAWAYNAVKHSVEAMSGHTRHYGSNLTLRDSWSRNGLAGYVRIARLGEHSDLHCRSPLVKVTQYIGAEHQKPKSLLKALSDRSEILTRWVVLSESGITIGPLEWKFGTVAHALSADLAFSLPVSGPDVIMGWLAAEDEGERRKVNKIIGTLQLNRESPLTREWIRLGVRSNLSGTDKIPERAAKTLLYLPDLGFQVWRSVVGEVAQLARRRSGEKRWSNSEAFAVTDRLLSAGSISDLGRKVKGVNGPLDLRSSVDNESIESNGLRVLRLLGAVWMAHLDDLKEVLRVGMIMIGKDPLGVAWKEMQEAPKL